MLMSRILVVCMLNVARAVAHALIPRMCTVIRQLVERLVLDGVVR